MKCWFPILLSLLIAGPAAAQMHSRTDVVPIEGIAAEGNSLAAMKAFEVEPSGAFLHTASGFRCPRTAEGVVLTGIGEGSLPGLTGEAAVWCEYSDQVGPVARLSISRDPPQEPVLTQAFCRGLWTALKLPMGPGRLPGVSKTVGPAQQKTLPTLQIGGEDAPLWRCSTIREPYEVPTIVVDVSALRAPNGWTVRAIHTPAPPPCCASYRDAMPFTFFTQALLLVWEATDAKGPPLSPMAVVGLKPGAP